MSRALPIRPKVVSFGALALVVTVVTFTACRSHKAPSAMSSQSATQGRGAGGHQGAAAPGVALAAFTGGSNGAQQPVAMTGTGGSPGGVHLVTTTGVTGRQEDPSDSILGKLHKTDIKEIEMGKMAEKNGHSKEMKNFGKMLVRDHSAADKRVLAFAKAEHIDIAVPAEKMAAPKKPEPGPNFDTEFAKEMVQDHQHDIAEVTSVRDSTKDAKLKTLLGSLLPVLEKHEKTAQKLVDQSSNEHK